MFKKVWMSVCVSMVCFFAQTSAIRAQESATIQAKAYVLPCLTIIGTNDLDFEYVLPGVRKAIAKSDVGEAGEWVVLGSSTAEVTLDFALPDSLRRIDGLAAMKIGFNSADASFENEMGSSQTAPSGVLNPYVISTRALGTDGSMIIWLGGTVYPTRSQESGDYRADIVLTATYTGN